MDASPTLKVLKASAGSGKTYALVREYLVLALLTKRKDYYRHILAITFTNAAASEMKERVLKQLRGFAGGNSHTDFDSPLFISIAEELSITSEELQQRAAGVFEHMLHNYSQISISTIDSFTHKLIRSFSRDLRLSPDFSVEINSLDFIEKLVDRCLELVGNEPQLSSYLERFVLDNFEEETSWNVRNELIDFAQSLLLESSREPLLANEHLGLNDFSRIRKSLNEYVQKFETRVGHLCSSALQLISDAGLSATDFSGKHAVNFFEKNLELEWKLPNATLFKQLDSESFATQKTPAHIRQKLDEVFPSLREGILNVAELLTGTERKKYELCSRLLHGIYSVGLLNELQHIAQQLREEENLLLIADFQKLVSEIVVDNPAPFIYERLGERYHHILFDEFQDTSEMQWANFLPLIENSLSKGKFNLLVGDAKQAIYRWRNGNVAQFINLPEIKTDKARATLQPLLRSAFSQESLKENYRSGMSIVHFNNSLYSVLKDGLRIHQNVYDDNFQIPKKKWNGLVRIDRSLGVKVEERLPITHQLIHRAIVESIEDGFLPCDIAVLVRKGKQGSALAAYLLEQNLRVQTADSFLLRNSAAVNVLINVMRILHNNDDHASAVLMVQSLAQIFPDRISIGDILKKYTHGTREQFTFEIENFFIEHFPDVNFHLSEYNSLYALAAKIISSFEIIPDSYVEFFLQHIHEQGTLHHKSLAQFLEWWNDNHHRLFAVTPGDPQAVKIMTIHKAKGLQFPVVIFPMYISKDMGTMMWVDASSVNDELKYGYVNYTPKNDTEFSPTEFETENQMRELDDLNLMYVATTRPEKRLYIVHEKKAAEQQDEFDEACAQIYDDYHPGDETWQTGMREMNDQVTPTDSTTEFIHPVFSDHNPKVRYTSAESEDALRIAHRHFGIVLHDLLARIKSVNDFESVLKTISPRPLDLSDEESEQLKSALHSIIHHSEISHWFLPGLNVKTEAELITADGKTLRPDRIVLYDDHLDVLDFKTGEPNERHKEQVKEYVKYIEEITEMQCNGFLVYSNSPEVAGEIPSPIVIAI